MIVATGWEIFRHVKTGVNDENKKQLFFYLQFFTILSMFPSAVITYRASLFRMPIFAEIKRKKDAKENKYSNLNWVKNLNCLFFFGEVQSMSYHKY